MTVIIRRATPSRVQGAVVHYRTSPYDYYIGRNAAKYGVPKEKDIDLGNPFHVEKYGRLKSIAKFERYARNVAAMSESFADRIRQCHEKTLGCHCAPLPCHGTVILKLAKELVLAEADKRFGQPHYGHGHDDDASKNVG